MPSSDRRTDAIVGYITGGKSIPLSGPDYDDRREEALAADTDHPGLDLDEVLADAGYDDIVAHGYDVLFDNCHALTRCPEGCEVEPDGRCSHGFASILLENGMI